MELPIPKHLNNVLKADEVKSNETTLSAQLLCCNQTSCHYYLGKYNDIIVVAMKCTKCGKRTVIFDSRLHGWDGFVCNNKNIFEIGIEQVKCEKCENNVFHANLKILSEGKQDFIEETNGAFPAEDWVNAFSWIEIQLTCIKCGKKTKILNYETM